MNKKVVFIILTVLLVLGFALSLCLGQMDISMKTIFLTFTNFIGITADVNILAEDQAAVLYNIRIPRTLIAILVGAALAVTGAVMQGLFGNPLADPSLIGLSSGASLGAVVAIVTGLTAYGMFYMPFLAFVFALMSVALTISLAMKDKKIPPMMLLLAGVSVSIFIAALTSGILTFTSEHNIREFLFWTVGGLDYRRWEHVYLIFIPVIAGIGVLCLLARHLNILSLGEVEASSVGVPVVKLRLILLSVASLTTAAAVSVSGSIGFVGLVVPHIMRLILGPEHRTLLPACALFGAVFLLFCDILSRVVIAPMELRVGITTALIGAPYFLYLLKRAQKEGLF